LNEEKAIKFCFLFGNHPSISSTYTHTFFVRNFGSKAETYLEKAVKKDVHTKNSYVKHWWNWHHVSHILRLYCSSLVKVKNATFFAKLFFPQSNWLLYCWLWRNGKHYIFFQQRAWWSNWIGALFANWHFYVLSFFLSFLLSFLLSFFLSFFLFCQFLIKHC